MNKAEVFDEIVQERRSVRIFDAELPFDHEAVQRSLERAVLAPNSSNLQLWEFHRIKSSEMLEKMVPLCLSQNAAKTARELLVVVCRKDLWKQRKQFNLDFYTKLFKGDEASSKYKQVKMYYGKIIPFLYTNDSFGILGGIRKLITTIVGFRKPMAREVSKSDTRVIAHKSIALAAQTFMLSMKAEGYDTCPMEGIDSLKIRKLLKLPSGAQISMVIASGPGSSKGIYTERYRVANKEVIKIH